MAPHKEFIWSRYFQEQKITMLLILWMRHEFYINCISENSLNQIDLFNATRKLLKQENKVLFPPSKINCNWLLRWATFLSKKICDIHSKLDKMTELPSCDFVSLASSSESVATMETFSQLTESNVRDLVLSSAKKTCMFDPIPTPLVVNCLDVLLPVLTKNHKHIYNVWSICRWMEACTG